MSTYKDLVIKFGSVKAVAEALGFVKPDMDKKQSSAQVARVCNWNKTGIPARHQDKVAALLAE